jgi:hypothetical protein
VVIAVGQAGGRTELSIERVAINVDDARIADNAGAQPIDAPIAKDGPVAYFSTLPIKAIVRDMRAAGVPAMVSQTAGTFVCNHVFYGLMHVLAHRKAGSAAPTRGDSSTFPICPNRPRVIRGAEPRTRYADRGVARGGGHVAIDGRGYSRGRRATALAGAERPQDCGRFDSCCASVAAATARSVARRLARAPAGVARWPARIAR